MTAIQLSAATRQVEELPSRLRRNRYKMPAPAILPLPQMSSREQRSLLS